MKTNFSRLIIAVLCMASLYAPQFTFAQKPSKQSTTPAKPFELSVDSIMRGPRLVGYPPTGSIGRVTASESISAGSSLTNRG
jgi:hypothetical protein